MESAHPPHALLQDLVLWLCAIPSPTGEEQLICQSLVERLEAIGLPNNQVRRYGDSLFVELSRGRPGPTIALVGHTDVVRTQHDERPHIDGDRLYGPGASDMKSGLALMLALAAYPVRTDANLVLIFYAGEEGPYDNNQLALVLDHEPSLRDIDLALVLEPTDNQLQLGCGGTLHAQVIFTGKSAHSARPWQGDNAIYRAIDLLTRLAALEPVPRSVEGLEWVTSKSVTLAHGGCAPNVIPERFELNVNARFAPDQSPEQIETELRALVGSEARVTIVDCSPPAQPFRQHPLIQSLERSGAKGIAPKFGWTDVARFSAMGIAAANFGPGTLCQAHQRNEWTSVTELLYADVVLRRWLGAIANPR